MANSLISPPEIEPKQKYVVPRRNVELHIAGDDLLGSQQGIFASLMESIRDVFFPKKLPPLVLESQPVAVVDRMAVKRDPTSTAIAVVLHVVIIGLLIYLAARTVRNYVDPKKATIVTLDVPVPPPAPPKAVRMGGGGGQKGPAPVSKGSPPKFSPVQIVPPKASVIAPKLAVAPTIDVDPHLKMATNMPNVGMPNAANVGVSMGNGNGSGLGSGNGNGMGPGSGGNTGGGIRQVGGGVSSPKVLTQVEAEFSEEARKAKYMGVAIVDVVVDERGIPIRVRVVSDPGMGLGEKAVEAVKQYRFKPGMENGKPVKTEVNISIDFHIY